MRCFNHNEAVHNYVMKKDCKKCDIIKKNNDTMREQAARIVELKKQLNNLCVELEEYKKKEKQIIQVLAFAKEKAEEIIQDAKIKYALECQRLRLYRNKWMRYIKDKNREGKLAADIEKTNEVLKECQSQLEDMLYTDLGIDKSVVDSYIYERERIDAEPALNYKAIIEQNLKLEEDDEEDFDGEDKITDEELEKMLEKLRM